jgi:hypothetical protein
MSSEKQKMDVELRARQNVATSPKRNRDNTLHTEWDDPSAEIHSTNNRSNFNRDTINVDNM